ncbi:MAG: DUF4268 domain-containing protein [Salinivirgaceae bacterium]
MYSKEENRLLRQEFWTTFDKYTQFFGKKTGAPIKWMLYKTGIKGLELKFELEPNHITVCIELNHKNEDRRFAMFVFLDTYRNIINQGFAPSPIWNDDLLTDTNKTVAQVYVEKTGLNFHNRDHWPAIYEFMASNMLRLQTNLQDILPLLQEEFGR